MHEDAKELTSYTDELPHVTVARIANFFLMGVAYPCSFHMVPIIIANKEFVIIHKVKLRCKHAQTIKY